ncbi:MAG: hypothetical protein V4613_12765 [Bacteroidota bacterium]
MIRNIQFNITIHNYIQRIKKLFVLIVVICIPNFLICQQVIHRDPFDIKKTNVSVFLFFRPIGTGTGGPQLRISHYINPRIMFNVNGYLGVVSAGGYEWGPAKQSQNFEQGTFEVDLHLIDHFKNKRVNIFYPISHSDTVAQGASYDKFESSVRRILCFTGGIQMMNDRQKLTSKKQDKEQSNELPMTELNTGKDTILTHARISTNASYTNILLGFKFKSIGATSVKFKDGNSFNDIHLEAYFSVIIPLSYSYEKYLYNSFFSDVPTHRLNDYSPSPGFKIGVVNRNSIKNNWTFGFELGIQPTIAPRYLNGTFIHASLGYSLNFGKVKYESF